MYAFSYRDFTKPPPASAAGKNRSPIYVARMTLAYAFRDALGLKDLVEDTRATLRGEGINYRAFEPSEGGMHIGAARDRRIRAGLRYAAGGKRKYWLPEVRGHPENDGDVTAPLFAADADDVVHDAPDMQNIRRGGARIPGDDVDVEDDDEYALTFSDALTGADEVLYEHAKKYVFGDYLYPVVDVSSEEARRAMWEEEERVVRDIASGGFSRPEGTFSGYGATQNGKRQARTYHDDHDDEGAGPHQDQRAPRTPQTPSPPRSRKISDCPPMTSRSRTSSHQSHPHTPTQLSSRLQLPRLLSPSSTSSSPRATKRAPLVEEDAVDLVVPADSLQVPSTSRGPHSPHSPVLIRVWDEVGPGAMQTVANDDEGDREGDASESDVRFVITVDDDREAETDGRVYGEDDAAQDVVREQTPPPHAGARGYGHGIPEEEDNDNPWA